MAILSGMTWTQDTLRWLLSRLPERELREKLQTVEAEMAQLARARNALRMAIDARELAAEIGGEALGPSTPAEPPRELARNGRRPGTRAALRAVLMRAPNRTMSTSDIMRELEANGWLPQTSDPRKAVGAALSTMVHKTKELEYLERATYRLRDGTESDSPSSDVSEGESEETDGNRLFIGPAVGEAGSKAS
jgi:hypothetical protein